MTNKAKHAVPLAVSVLDTPVGKLNIYANEQALVKVIFEEHDLDCNEAQDNSISRLGCLQLSEYLQGTRKQFDLPLAPQGTAFQQQVWQQLLKVEYGHTASYLDIANAISNPKACRAVGAANGKNPIAIIIPCHRVIGANGSLTGYAGGLPRKTFLLSLEHST